MEVADDGSDELKHVVRGCMALKCSVWHNTTSFVFQLISTIKS